MMWLVAGGAVFAGAAAAAAGAAWAGRCAREARARAMKAAAGADAAEDAVAVAFACEGVAARVLGFIRACGRHVRESGGMEIGRSEPGSNGALAGLGSRARDKVRKALVHAGMADVPANACGEAAWRLAVMAAAAGALVGFVVSPAMAAFLGMAAAIAGAWAPWWALSRERRGRAGALARELPEMLEVIALGLRSGLTFDRSFLLYPEYFGTPFAGACAAAADRWSLGLATREEALTELAASYDSPLFARTVSGILQSLRRGTSLVQDLELAAEESRKQFRAAKEEVVAKAPVKMMLPIGTLILPAMLLFVLGPVLLELIGGF